MPRVGPNPAIAGSESLLQLRNALDDPRDVTFAVGGQIVLSEYLPSILSSSEEDTAPETPAPKLGNRGLSQKSRSKSQQPPPPEDALALDLTNLTMNPNDNEDYGGEDIVTIRWDPKDPETPASKTKIDFPGSPETSKNLHQLITDMHPTDQGYELTPEFFSCTFNPYTCGIIDLASQTLLPALAPPSSPTTPPPGKSIEAYLYRLTVHTTKQNLTSDKRKRTKLGRTATTWPGQIGTLIINLPTPHTGGDIIVRRKGARKPTEFSWWRDSTPDRHVISWAAFYAANADTEYEIGEVTAGFRVSLMYNLFRVRGNGQMGNLNLGGASGGGDAGGGNGMLDVTRLPIYKTVRGLVSDEAGWGEEGGWVGFFCSHEYPHTTGSKGIFKVPENLVGVDLLMCRVLKSFGKLEVRFRPVVGDLELGGEVIRAEPIVGMKYGRAKLREYVVDGDDLRGLKGIFEDWAVKGGISEEDESGGSGRVEEDGEFIGFDDVHWLNGFGHEEPNIVAAGQQQGKDSIVNSCLAMIVKVPPGGASPKGSRRALRNQRPRRKDDGFPPAEMDDSSDDDFVEDKPKARRARGGKCGRGRPTKGHHGGTKKRGAEDMC